MADIVNLRRARKAARRAEAAMKAEANRAEHGVAKTARVESAAQRNRQRTILESKKLDSGN